MKFKLFLLTSLAAVVYGPFLGGGWLTDDFAHILHLQHQSLPGVFASPDAFGYYRPLAQATLLANLFGAGPFPFAFRLTNLALQMGVIGAAFVLARLLLRSERGAFLATLAFMLTPKAHPIAVQWVSARPELLMALFSLLAVVSWIRWSRGDGRQWYGAAWACYMLALLSKEPAALLPVLLLATPPGSRCVTLRRVCAAGGMVLTAALMLLVRVRVGARLPLPDVHYEVLAPIGRDVYNAWNYLTRAIPSPIGLVAAAGVVAGLSRGRQSSGTAWYPATGPALASLCSYAIVWFAVFIVLVLPFEARSELYLYFSGFGLCVLAGALAELLLAGAPARRAAIAVTVYAVAFGGYQFARAATAHEVATFSSRLAGAFARDDGIRHAGLVVLVPEDSATERRLQDAVGGFLSLALRLSLNRTDIEGIVAKGGRAATPDGLRLICAYRDATVILSHSLDPARGP